MIQAYIAGFSAAVDSGLADYPTKREASDWFDNEYGLTIIDEPCDCCEETDEDGDT